MTPGSNLHGEGSFKSKERSPSWLPDFAADHSTPGLEQRQPLNDLASAPPVSRLRSPIPLASPDDRSKLGDSLYVDGDEIAGRYVLIGEAPDSGPVGRGAFG